MGKDDVREGITYRKMTLVEKGKAFVAKHKLGVGIALGFAVSAGVDLLAGVVKGKKVSEEDQNDPYVEE